VALAFSFLAVVEGAGGRRATQAGERILLQGPFEEFVAPTHPVIVAGTFSGVVGCGDQPHIGGELIGALEGREVSNTDQELGAEDRTHPRQASDDLRLLSGEKTLSQLRVEGLDASLGIEHLPGELGDNASGDVLRWKGDALGFGSCESLLRETIVTFDAAVSEVGSDPIAARAADLRRSLVVSEEGERTAPIQVQCPLQ